jgi:sigma-B regulation protein RsbU (phosphoserine phosphatase)
MISDASGRGPSAAVVAAILHTLLQSLFRHHGTETGVPALLPKDVLAIANAEFAAKQIERSFVTTFLAIWNSTTATLVYSLAGHNPPLLLRAADRTISELWAGGGLPLGIFPEQSYVQHELRLFSGDVLVLFSDGIVEAEISEGESFDLERLRPALQSVRDGGARGILATLRTAVEQHQKNSRPLDDQTLLVLKVI